MYDIFFVFCFMNMNGGVCKLWARRLPRMNLVINAGHVLNLDPMKIYISINISQSSLVWSANIVWRFFIRYSFVHVAGISACKSPTADVKCDILPKSNI